MAATSVIKDESRSSSSGRDGGSGSGSGGKKINSDVPGLYVRVGTSHQLVPVSTGVSIMRLLVAHVEDSCSSSSSSSSGGGGSGSGSGGGGGGGSGSDSTKSVSYNYALDGVRLRQTLKPDGGSVVELWRTGVSDRVATILPSNRPATTAINTTINTTTISTNSMRPDETLLSPSLPLPLPLDTTTTTAAAAAAAAAASGSAATVFCTMPLPMSNSGTCPAIWIQDSNSSSLTSQQQLALAPPRYPFARVAAAVLLVDVKGRVLLTRRAAHMRTFPGAWVAPGGGLDVGETLPEAAAREVYEETGLKVSPDMLHPLCLWESLFPNSAALCLKQGQVLSQYAILFFRAHLEEQHQHLRVRLQISETDAYCWIEPDRLKEFCSFPAATAAADRDRRGTIDRGAGTIGSGSSSSSSSSSSTETSTSVVVTTQLASGATELIPLSCLSQTYGATSRYQGTGEAHRYAIKCLLAAEKNLNKAARPVA